MDRNRYYGGVCASLSLENLFRKFKGRDPTSKELEALGGSADYSVDLIPKLIMANGRLIDVLVDTGVDRYVDLSPVQGSYAVKRGTPHKVPSSGSEAVRSNLVGFLQKRWLRSLLQLCAGFDPNDAKTHGGYDVNGMTAQQLFEKLWCDEKTAEFVGHCLALRTNNSYLSEPAHDMIAHIQLYMRSLLRFGAQSPFLYPWHGLGSLPEAFARMSSIWGGTFQLERDITEILLDESGDGAVLSVVSEDPLDHVVEAADVKAVVGDPSYFAPAKSRCVGRVVRRICLLRNPIPGLDGGADSAQLIIPQSRCVPPRENDIYICMIGQELRCAPHGFYVATVSTMVETQEPLQELLEAMRVIGGSSNIIEHFDEVSEYLVPTERNPADRCFLSSSYDATTHFESVMEDALSLYERVKATLPARPVPSPAGAAHSDLAGESKK